MQLSIVIPLLNEHESLEQLFSRIDSVCKDENISYEVIFIDDGSTDSSWDIIERLSTTHSEVKGIRFSQNYGKSQALHASFKEAKGEVIITMDADLQDFPEEIPPLYKMIVEGNHDLVSGWKKKRFDNVLTKNIPSKLFNWSARKISGVQLHDFNCGLKAYKSEVVKNIDVHGDMHRYIPVLAKNAGFNNITEKEVKHQARPYGHSKFGTSRFLIGFLDLLTIGFLSKFGNKPMHLFGGAGSLMFLIGFIASAWLGTNKLIKVWKNIPARLVTDNPLFYIALTMMILGTLLFIAGFLGELIVRLKRDKNTENYKISDTKNL